jgi:hypothetical protein
MFVVVHGRRFCGKVDIVPGLCYVKTQFAHIYWVPLIPLRSYIILEGSENGTTFKGVPTRMRWKSVLYGWLRGACVVGIIAGVFGLLVSGARWANELLTDSATLSLVSVSVAAGCVFCYWLSIRTAQASYSRALELAEEVGIPLDLLEEHLAATTEHETPAGYPGDEDETP